MIFFLAEVNLLCLVATVYVAHIDLLFVVVSFITRILDPL